MGVFTFFCAGSGTRSRVNRCCDFARPRLGAFAPLSFESHAPSIKNTPVGVLLIEDVPEVGLEPTSLAAHDFESCAYTNSAIPARGLYYRITASQTNGSGWLR